MAYQKFCWRTILDNETWAKLGWGYSRPLRGYFRPFRKGTNFLCFEII